MSKYTTEVRFLCESLTGHDESKGFNDVEQILTEAAPIIFSFNFPIFDETYRLPLERKILRHYYTREISEETYGLWKLRLDDRMNVIMPYYNQLYRSTLLSFNPFYDVDLTTEHSGSENGVTDTAENEKRRTDNTSSNSVNENVNEVLNKSGDNENVKTENRGNTINENGTENNVKVGDNSSVKSNSGTIVDAHTGTVTDENYKEHNVINNENENGQSTEHKEGDRTGEYEGNTAQSGDSTSDRTESGTNQNTQWDLFSDTPQGGINGLSTGNPSAPAGLENNLYLTTARKVTDNGQTSNTANEKGSTSNVGVESSTSKDSNEENNTVNTQNARDNVETGSASENGTKTYNESNQKTLGNSEENVGNYVESNDNTSEKQRTENMSGSENVTGAYNEINTNNIGRNSSMNGELNENSTADKTGSKVSTTTDEYLQKVVGKSGGMTYSAMLTEYRDTFINIDEMIIEELSDLFFGLW